MIQGTVQWHMVQWYNMVQWHMVQWYGILEYLEWTSVMVVSPKDLGMTQGTMADGERYFMTSVSSLKLACIEWITRYMLYPLKYLGREVKSHTHHTVLHYVIW